MSINKLLELGQEVFVQKYYQRNDRNPHAHSKDQTRYKLKELNKKGIFVGTRTINITGYTDYSDGYLTFYPGQKETVCLVAIDKKTLVYVPGEYICLVGIDIAT